MQYFGPEDREEEASLTRHHHVADQWHAQRHQSHAHGHVHHSVDVECLLDEADSDGETDSADDVEPIIGRKRQIIGILVRHFPSHDRWPSNP
jgi:hypothetical protein